MTAENRHIQVVVAYDFTTTAEQALLRAHQVRIVGVPYTPSGPDLNAFEAVLVAERPRLYITNSALHNPTGATLSPQTAHRLLTSASAHDLTIVEEAEDVPADALATLAPAPEALLARAVGQLRSILSGPTIQARCLECPPMVAAPPLNADDRNWLMRLLSWS